MRYQSNAQVVGNAVDGPKWKCFHCREEFCNDEAARQHFGPNEMHEPACQIDIAKYREMEERFRLCAEEDTDLHREIARLHSDHNLALQREEEKGYARGLRDSGLCPCASQEQSPTAKSAEPMVNVVTIDVETAKLIRKVFLPANPNKMRSAAPETIAAVRAFIEAVAQQSVGEGK